MTPAPPHDRRGRVLHDLRISVTDRCNFRCRYCMPREAFGEGHTFLPRAEILTFEEIERVARVSIGLGVRKLRLTGGEPLLRRDLHHLVAMLARLTGGADLALTTNGSLLAQQARALRAAGLHRLTVSLDALTPDVFAAMSDSTVPLRDVLRGIDAAREAGFTPIKINMVVKRGVNDSEIPALVRRFGGPDFVLRFIEYMDVGNTNHWQRNEVFSADEIVSRVRETAGGLEPLASLYDGEVARRFRTAGGGEIGIIASVTAPFCAGCTRARLSADGRLYPCLFASSGRDLRSLLRSGANDQTLKSAIADFWSRRDERYSEVRNAASVRSPKVEMSHIGG